MEEKRWDSLFVVLWFDNSSINTGDLKSTQRSWSIKRLYYLNCSLKELISTLLKIREIMLTYMNLQQMSLHNWFQVGYIKAAGCYKPSWNELSSFRSFSIPHHSSSMYAFNLFCPVTSWLGKTKFPKLILLWE